MKLKLMKDNLIQVFIIDRQLHIWNVDEDNRFVFIIKQIPNCPTTADETGQVIQYSYDKDLPKIDTPMKD